MAIIFLLLHCDHCANVSRCLAWFLFIEMFLGGGGQLQIVSFILVLEYKCLNPSDVDILIPIPCVGCVDKVT